MGDNYFEQISFDNFLAVDIRVGQIVITPQTFSQKPENRLINCMIDFGLKHWAERNLPPKLRYIIHLHELSWSTARYWLL